jgi:hypothetical protein
MRFVVIAAKEIRDCLVSQIDQRESHCLEKTASVTDNFSY